MSKLAISFQSNRVSIFTINTLRVLLSSSFTHWIQCSIHSLITMTHLCLKCSKKVRKRQEAILCDNCQQWCHRTCGTGTTVAQTEEPNPSGKYCHLGCKIDSFKIICQTLAVSVKELIELMPHTQ